MIRPFHPLVPYASLGPTNWTVYEQSKVSNRRKYPGSKRKLCVLLNLSTPHFFNVHRLLPIVGIIHQNTNLFAKAKATPKHLTPFIVLIKEQ